MESNHFWIRGETSFKDKTNAILCLYLKINEWQIILNARQYLGENEPIVFRSSMSSEMQKTIIEFVSKQLFEEKSVFNICKNAVQMLDMTYGNSWQCLADYEDSSMAYFTIETGFYIKFSFGLLQFKVFKEIHCINIDNSMVNLCYFFPSLTNKILSNGSEKWILNTKLKSKANKISAKKWFRFIKREIFTAIERFDTLSDILKYLQNKLGKEYGGQWFCLGFSMGAFPLTKIKSDFIEFQLLNIKFTIFRAID